MHTHTRCFAALVMAGVLLGAAAAAQAAPPAPASSNTWIGVPLSTLGVGVEARQGIGDSFAARLGLNTYSLDKNATIKDVQYHARLRLQTVEALADFYPTAKSAFHVTAGLMDNLNHATGDGQPSPNSGLSTFTINGVTYPTSQLGSLNARLSFPRTAPYLGIGVGRPGGTGVRGFFDIGVLFQGKPHLDLNATINAAVDPQTAAQIQQNVAAERDREQSDLNKYQYYPVVSAGIAYSF